MSDDRILELGEPLRKAAVEDPIEKLRKAIVTVPAHTRGDGTHVDGYKYNRRGGLVEVGGAARQRKPASAVSVGETAKLRAEAEQKIDMKLDEIEEKLNITIPNPKRKPIERLMAFLALIMERLEATRESTRAFSNSKLMDKLEKWGELEAPAIADTVGHVEHVLHYITAHPEQIQGLLEAVTVNNPLLKATGFDPRQPRDPIGRWTLGPSLEVDLPTQRGRELPSLEYQTPPERVGSPNRDPGGVSSFEGMTNTRFGDAVESALQDQMSLRTLHPDRRQGALDVVGDTHAFEVKAVSVHAAEYKAKPKKREAAAKRREARRLGLRPAMIIVVVDEGGTGHVYWKEGIGAYRVSADMEYAGTVSVPLSVQKAFDPRQPRDPIGRWVRFKLIVDGSTTNEPGVALEEAGLRVARAKKRGARDIQARVQVGQTRQFRMPTEAETRALADEAAHRLPGLEEDNDDVERWLVDTLSIPQRAGESKAQYKERMRVREMRKHPHLDMPHALEEMMGKNTVLGLEGHLTAD